MSLPDRIPLPFRFDPNRLRADVDALPADAWIPHFNTGVYEGDWSAVPLRGPAGETHPIRQITPIPGCEDFVATAYLDCCPHLAAVLDHLDCTVHAARLLRLGVGAVVREHRDYNLGFDDGEVRLHVPITTSPEAEFLLAGSPVNMQPGECWYLNFNLPHALANRGTEDRIHLVIDCKVNDWLTATLGAAVHDPAQPGP
jgi:hypothetical protein